MCHWPRVNDSVCVRCSLREKVKDVHGPVLRRKHIFSTLPLTHSLPASPAPLSSFLSCALRCNHTYSVPFLFVCSTSLHTLYLILFLFSCLCHLFRVSVFFTHSLCFLLFLFLFLLSFLSFSLSLSPFQVSPTSLRNASMSGRII